MLLEWSSRYGKSPYYSVSGFIGLPFFKALSEVEKKVVQI
jgi:hypothetical protein